MNAKRWLVTGVLLAAIGWARGADATINQTPAGLTIGGTGVQVGQMASATGTLTESDAATPETIMSFDTTATNCGLFTITTDDPLPVTIVHGTPEGFTATFKPVARGTFVCTVTMLDMGGASLGTFTVQGIGLSPQLGVLPASPASVGSARVSTNGTTTTNFTLSNSGNENLTISANGINFTGGNATDFSVMSPSLTNPIVIAPAGNITVVVLFAPSVVGARTTTMGITSDDPASPTNIVLNGVGTSPVIKADDFTWPAVVNDGAINTQSTTIENSGTDTLHIASASITNSTWITFTTANGCTTGTQSCTFTSLTATAATAAHVSLKCTVPAGSTGSQTATVTYTSDTDPTGADSTASVTCTAGQPIVALDFTTLAFPATVVGATSASMPTKITNTGNTTYTYNVALTGLGASSYAIASGCTSNCTLLAGANVAVPVTFTPLVIGAAPAATLAITSTNAAFDLTDLDATLTGTGDDPFATLTAPASGSITFTDTEVGATATAQTITVTNTGNTDLTITSAALTVATNYVVTGTAGMQTVTAGTTASWTVACKPTTFGVVDTNFKILNNGHGSSPITVPIHCNGLEGVLAVSQPSVDLGQVNVGAQSSTTITLSNPGNVTVSMITGVFADTTLGYSVDVTTPVPASLMAGSNASIKIDFKPTMTALGGNDNLVFTGKWGGVPTTTTVTEACTGQGLTTGYQLFPSPLAFGDVRFDSPTSVTLSIRNNAQAVFALDLPVVGVTGSTTVNTFTLGTIVEHVGGAVITTWPHTMAANEQIDATVTVTPGTQLGALTGSVSTTTDVSGNKMISITANSTSAMLSVDPTATLVFAAQDVQHTTGATQDIVLTNNGTGTLDVTGATIMSPDAAFTIIEPTFTAHVGSNGGTLSIPVTYLPTIAGMNTTTLQLQLHGDLFAGGELMTATIPITGTATDRSISAPTTLAFPPTFRNPGTAAPTMAVNVANLGAAPLDISSAMLSGDSAFTSDAAAVAVPGNGSATFNVTFTPTSMGTFNGDLELTNDTTGHTMAHVIITGTGVARDVTVSPTTINLGITGVGVPVKLSDRGDSLIELVSMDTTTTFQIREISMAGDDVFVVDNPPTGVALAPQATQSYDLTFAPTTAGTFTGMVNVYLDQDPTPQATLAVTGQAVDIDIHGGGCNAGGGDASGGALGILGMFGAVGALGAFGRRRRGVAAIAASAAAAVIALGGAAHADPTRNLDLSDFNPTPATVNDSFQLQSPDVGASGDWAVGAVFSYATNPLSIDGGGMTDSPITARSMIDVGGAYAFLNRFEVAARLPLFDQSGDNPQFSGVTPPKGTAIGDLTLSGKARLLRHDGLAGGTFVLGAGVALTLPTASSGDFTGVSDPTGRAIALGSWSRDRLMVDLNLGAVLRAKSELASIEQGSGLVWGVGASYRVLDKLWVGAEVFGEADIGVTAMKAVSPVEGMIGAHYRIERRVTIGAAVGHGLVDGIGAPDVRGVFSMAFVPGTADLAPIHLPPPPVIDGDRDGDGIPDSIDKCPDQPEDKDLFDDSDGCPDPDNDGDGIPDVVDKCPLDPEDFDGFQDADGCPDKDNDGDGIPDAVDKCPNQPEDKDGFQDLDGCPDLDNDGDGIPDAIDKCPNEPETINGFQDEDGCPDKGDSLVIVSPDRLEALEAIQFGANNARIAKASFNVLGQVAATLRAHVEIVRLRITAHVQPKDTSKDQELSDKRAAAVRDWLVQWGIAAERLEPRGFGGSKPLVDPAQKGASGINDRIELIILERK